METKSSLDKINYCLKFIIILGFVLLGLLSVVYKYDDCNKCSFDVNDTEMDAPGFLYTYQGKCLDVKKEDPNVLGNFSWGG